MNYVQSISVPDGDEKTVLDTVITDILLRVGIPASYKGYIYLRCAMIAVYYSPELVEHPSKMLYPMVARLCGAPSAESVGRACRRAIDIAFENDVDLFRELFKFNFFSGSMMCAYFISSVSEFVHKLLDNRSE